MNRMQKPLWVWYAALVGLAIGAAECRADVRLAPPFGDHMVLQRSHATPIFGAADAGEEVRVTVGDISGKMTADAQGHWRVDLDLSDKGGAATFVVQGHNRVELKDVLIGEVWVCSGQSNMEFPLGHCDNGAAEVAGANQAEIRLFATPYVIAQKPATTMGGNWVVCKPETATGFSAVGYLFGREIHQATKLPVGLIGCYWGGTPAEAWTSAEALEAEPGLSSFTETIEKFRAADLSAVGTSKRGVAGQPAYNQHTATALYNGMVHPLIRFGIRGVIWYQGESNADRAFQYRTVFPTMICDWRDRWGEGDFPFYFVQLPNYVFHDDGMDGRGGDSAWAELREAQVGALGLANTGMAVTIDSGTPHNIHPPYKQVVGHRLALIALARDYGKTVEYCGPMFGSLEIDGATAIVRFTHGEGLKAIDGKLVGFEVAGEDRKWAPARATIEGTTVRLVSDGVGHPVAARYAWADNPTWCLANSAGLLASPFRTDSWPRKTAGAH
jgi:sialate O-acetylesterase